MTAARINRAYAVAAIADAASVRWCDSDLLAVQQTSPNQPFNLSIARQFQIDLSVHFGRTRRLRDKPGLGFFTFVDAACAEHERQVLRCNAV